MRALLLNRTESGIESQVERVDESRLPQGDVLVDVEYSSLNYKDGLAVTGRGSIVRSEFPFVPGIDLAGTVVESGPEGPPPGTKVLQTGQGLGESHWGGYAEKARVDRSWLIEVPEGMSTHDVMVIGTAGHTAMLSTMALEAHEIAPDDGEIVVTGASGGVGSFSVAILSSLGYNVVALTGKEEAHEQLTALGAARIEPREYLGDSKRPLESGRWAGGVDATGGWMLDRLLAQTGLHGCVASCGNAAGIELHTTVLPFILRGVTLQGIDSNTSVPERRREAWRRLSEIVDDRILELIHARDVGLGEIADEADRITRGKALGRVVIDLSL